MGKYSMRQFYTRTTRESLTRPVRHRSASRGGSHIPGPVKALRESCKMAKLTHRKPTKWEMSGDRFALPAHREGGLMIETKRSMFVIADLVLGAGSCCAAG